MIENMRKYTGLMVVVFILLGAGFLFTMNDIGTGSPGGGSGPAVLEVHGQSFDRISYEKEGSRTLQLCSEVGMHNYINFLMAPDAQQMQQALQLGRVGFNYYTMLRGNLTEQDVNRFVANRVILQHSMQDMGLFASEEQVSETIKELPAFAPNGKYDASRYAEFIEKRLGRLGMTEKTFRDLVRENICLNKLVNIVGGNLTPPRSAIQDLLEANMQTVTLAKVAFNRDDFIKKENPTEEEVKAYWEQQKDAYKTEEQRRISYYLIDLPEEKAEEPVKAEEEKPESTDPEAVKKAAEEKAAKAAEKAKKRAEDVRELKLTAKNFYNSIIDAERNKQELDFTALVAKYDGNVVGTDLFTRSALPEALKSLRRRDNLNKNQPLADDIFSMKMSDKDYNRVSGAIPVGENAWIVFVLEEIVDPEVLEYKDAKDKAREQLIGENASEKVKEATVDARKKILDLMESGKDFDTAARELKFTPVQVGPFTATTRVVKGESDPGKLHSIARGLNPGDVSEPINELNRSLLLYVEKRELEDREENKMRVDGAMIQAETDLMVRTFLNWINHQYQLAEVKSISDEG